MVKTVRNNTIQIAMQFLGRVAQDQLGSLRRDVEWLKHDAVFGQGTFTSQHGRHVQKPRAQAEAAGARFHQSQAEISL
jgi:hypothetical protein